MHNYTSVLVDDVKKYIAGYGFKESKSEDKFVNGFYAVDIQINNYRRESHHIQVTIQLLDLDNFSVRQLVQFTAMRLPVFHAYFDAFWQTEYDKTIQPIPKTEHY